MKTLTRDCVVPIISARLLRYFGKHLLGLALLAIGSEQQKSSGEPFLGRVEKLID
jgi:hypothetical protein